ncbi:MAG: chitin disaccharide deacetylase [Clostridiales bacterium]|nr:chitin disaccharide deacetylase [Clostridiales bacterium]
MVTIKLIVNADDFGLTKAVNLGIIEAFKNGIVRSTTLMPNQDATEHAAELAKENTGLGIGVHLTLTAGRPLLGGHKSIVKEDGSFLGQGALFESTIDPIELESEFDAQINKVINLGIKITHLDSHHHVHLNEKVQTVVIKLAKKYGLPVRDCHKDGIKSTEAFSMDFYGGGATIGHLKNILSQETGSLEVMAHPAYIDYGLYNKSGYAIPRVDELHILTSDEIKRYISENGIELCNFSVL